MKRKAQAKARSSRMTPTEFERRHDQAWMRWVAYSRKSGAGYTMSVMSGRAWVCSVGEAYLSAARAADSLLRAAGVRG